MNNQDEAKYLLEPADGDIDEDDGMTRLNILRMLTNEFNMTAQRRPGATIKFSKETFLMVPAEGHIDEDNGLTKKEMMKMLASEIGCDLVPAVPAAVVMPKPRVVSRRR